MSRYCDSLSSQRGQIIEGPANHIKAFGPDPDGSAEGSKRRTGQRSAERSRVSCVRVIHTATLRKRCCHAHFAEGNQGLENGKDLPKVPC